DSARNDRRRDLPRESYIPACSCTRDAGNCQFPRHQSGGIARHDRSYTGLLRSSSAQGGLRSPAHDGQVATEYSGCGRDTKFVERPALFERRDLGEVSWSPSCVRFQPANCWTERFTYTEIIFGYLLALRQFRNFLCSACTWWTRHFG